VGIALSTALSAENTTRFGGLDGAVVSVAFADNEIFAAAASGNPGADRSGQIRLLSTTRSPVPISLQYESFESASQLSHRFTEVTFSRDGVYFAALSSSVKSLTRNVPGGARVWDFKSGKLVGVLPKARGFLSFSPDSKTLATSQSEDSLALYALPNFNEPKVVSLPKGEIVTRGAFGKDPNLLAIGTRSGLVMVYTLAGETHARFEAPPGPKRALAFSFSGAFIATIGADGRMAVWDTEKQTPLEFAWSQTAPATAVAFAPSGKTLATGHRDGSVRLWNLPENGRGPLKEREQFSLHRTPVQALAFSPDGKALATGGLDEIVLVTSLEK
jgi:WD40 repeat protein